MTTDSQNKVRILGISPTTKGLGFAVLEGEKSLVKWGVKKIGKDKNKECVEKLNELMSFFRPDVLAFENYTAKGSQRRARVRELGKLLLVEARKKKIKAIMTPRADLSSRLFGNEEEKKYKHDIAEFLVEEFPEELGRRVPNKRKAWGSEDTRMPMFDAVALAVAAGKQVAAESRMAFKESSK